MSRYSHAEKLEIIRLVEDSEMSLDMPRRTFYDWYRCFQVEGPDGLADRYPQRHQFWNKIPQQVHEHVVDVALEHTEKSPRQLAGISRTTRAISSANPVSIEFLKRYDLVTNPAFNL